MSELERIDRCIKYVGEDRFGELEIKDKFIIQSILEVARQLAISNDRVSEQFGQTPKVGQSNEQEAV